MRGKVIRFGHRSWQGVYHLRCRWFPNVYAGWAFALPYTAFVLGALFVLQASYRLEISVTTDRPAEMHVYYDEGAGSNEAHSAIFTTTPGSRPQAVSLPVNASRLTSIRFDPSHAPVVMRLDAMTLRSDAPAWLLPRTFHPFDLHDLQAVQQIDELTPEGEGLRIVVRDGNPIMAIVLPAPLELGPGSIETVGPPLTLALLGWLLLWGIITEAVRWLPTGLARAALPRRLPAAAVWLVAAVSVVLSCYPVIFLGKSFVSPNFDSGSFRLYGKFPTLPGTRDTVLENRHGVDLDAMNTGQVPYAIVASRALFDDGELPLWNRYNYCGLPLLGQGQSMLGDPLHCLVLAARGAAWSWDTKFVLAKWLFAAGAGFLVLAATDSLPAAVLLSFSAAFIGFFSYRLNHPAYFSLCYAPWVLFAWIRIVRAPTWRQAMRWAGGLLLANWFVMNSGTAKEAYMQLLGLNGSGALALLLSRQPLAARGRRFAGLLGAGIIYCLLAAPFLGPFLDTLKSSMSIYDTPHVWQLQPAMLIGLFDDIFYRQFKVGEAPVDPSANFLVLLGVLLALSTCKRLATNRVFLAVALGALPPLALAFGAAPPALIRQMPLLGNIIHLDNTFSCVLLIHLFVLAGFGLRHCFSPVADAVWRLDVLVAFALGGALLGLYFGFTQAATLVSYPFLKLDQEIARSPFFYGDVFLLTLATVPLPFVLRRLARRGPQFAVLATLGCCLFLIHWRMGLQVHTAFSPYTPVLPNRVDLQARSPAVEFLRGEQADAFRTVGLDGAFNLGYGGMAGLEGIHGPDALFNPYLFVLERTAMRDNPNWVSTPIDKPRLKAEKPFYDLMNVRYYLAAPDTELAEVSGLRKVRALDLDVYRDDDAWPRAFFVDQVELYDDATDFGARVRSGDGRPFAAIPATEQGSHPELSGLFAAAPSGRTVVAATHYRLTNHRTRFDLQAPAPGVLVLTEGYMDRNFKAALNGRNVPIFRVNEAFMGVFVDHPGSYQVSFNYSPRYFIRTLWAGGVGLVLLGVSGWWLWRRPGPRARQPQFRPAERWVQAEG